MKVNKAIETDDGTVLFQGELGPEELDLILSIGLNHLLRQGAIPFQVTPEEDMASFAPGSEEKQ